MTPNVPYRDMVSLSESAGRHFEHQPTERLRKGPPELRKVSAFGLNSAISFEDRDHVKHDNQ